MSRILRFGLLGVLCAVPFALPQASEAARPARVVPYRPVYTRSYCAPYHYHYWNGHRHGHAHHRR